MVLARAPPQAALSNDIQRALPWIRGRVDGPVVSRNNLLGLVAQGLSSRFRTFNKSVLQSHDNLLDAAIMQMSDACEILSFEEPKLRDILVINPPWLLHRVASVLLSPADFPPPHIVYNDLGRAKRRDAVQALEAEFARAKCKYLSGEATLSMLAELGISTFDEIDNDEGDIIVPSKMQNGRNLQGVLPVEETTTIWFGVQLRCTAVPLSVCFFPQLQVHLHDVFRNRCGRQPRLWSGGLAIALRHCTAFGIVETWHRQMGINIIVGGKEETLRECYALLQMLKEEAMLKVETFSPGSDISELILSSRELSNLDWGSSASTPKITYEKVDVEEAMERGGNVGSREGLHEAENAQALMAIPATHVRLMTVDGYERLCYLMNSPRQSERGQPRWYKLARRLGMRSHVMPSVDETNPTGHILRWWSQRSGQHTIEHLLAAVQAIGHPKAVSVLKKELAGPPTIRLPPLENFSRFNSSDESADERVEYDMIKTSTLLKIAHCFCDMFYCEQLAVFLDMSKGGNIIALLRSRNPHISADEAAFEVLKKWRGEKAGHATGEVLYDVLRNRLEMDETLLASFKHDLLRSAKPSAQNCVFESCV